MQIIDTPNLYSYICTETEWYLASDAERNAIVNQCKGAAADRDVRNVCIMVQPDAILSISPKPVRHVVWQYTAPMAAEDKMYHALMDVCEKYIGKGEDKLTLTQARNIARRVFG